MAHLHDPEARRAGVRDVARGRRRLGAAAATAGSPERTTRSSTSCTRGTGNPAPDFDGGVREGDNLYTDCVLAINPDNGEIRWHYQFNPHDMWDYDSDMEHILFELDGRKVLAHFNKNGYFFVLDRETGELSA